MAKLKLLFTLINALEVSVLIMLHRYFLTLLSTSISKVKV